MRVIILEPTNRCNRACLHCLRNREDPRHDLPLEIAGHILEQARELEIRLVCLTGGEVSLYPYLEDLIAKVVSLGFDFSLVTNGFRFREYVLPLLLEAKVKPCIHSVCFSLDGNTHSAHDALRGQGSYAEVREAIHFCRKNHLPLALKSAITILNQTELAQLALLGARLGAREHEFLFLDPTPTLIEKGLLPSPEELKGIAHWIRSDLAGAVTTKITVEGYVQEGPILHCGTIMNSLNVDYLGNLILCCQLSHVTMGDRVPTRFNGELVADLKEVSLKEGIIRQYRLAAKLMEHKLESTGKPAGISQTPCHWCLYHFGKLEWLKKFPASPWAQELLPNS
ncbi:MAG: radical SAM protein [Deltaproteobacteria bacterium]|nr:radical SAM protein [Deltaproteobacteria bacterium]